MSNQRSDLTRRFAPQSIQVGSVRSDVRSLKDHIDVGHKTCRLDG